jgi:hypothetical protein
LCVAISARPGRRWSWTRFRFIDTTSRVTSLFSDLREILSSDSDVQILGFPEAYPLPNLPGYMPDSEEDRED